MVVFATRTDPSRGHGPCTADTTITARVERCARRSASLKPCVQTPAPAKPIGRWHARDVVESTAARDAMQSSPRCSKSATTDREPTRKRIRLRSKQLQLHQRISDSSKSVQNSHRLEITPVHTDIALFELGVRTGSSQGSGANGEDARRLSSQTRSCPSRLA